MQGEKFIMRLLKNKHQFLLILCTAAILCFDNSVAAQSGRRPPKITPSLPVAIEPTIPPEKNDPPVKIASILIVGEIQENHAYFKSSSLNAGIDECLHQLKSPRNSTLEVNKGGKMTLKEAQDRAKKETDVYVLWLGFVINDDSYGNTQTAFTDYVVLMPKSAKQLTLGKVYFGKPSVISQGGVRIPVTSKRLPSLFEIEESGREIADILIHGGWLSN